MELINTIALAVIAAAAVVSAYAMTSGRMTGPQGPQGERGEQGPRGEAGERGLKGDSVVAADASASPLREDLSQVLRRDGDNWVHHAWVKDGSAAWQRAIDTPGLAVCKAGRIDEGAQ